MVGNMPGLLALSTPYKGALEILLCVGAWAVLAAGILHPFPPPPWNGIGAAGQGLFCLLEKCEVAVFWVGWNMLETAGKPPNPTFLVFLLLGLTGLAMPMMP